jgi:predicted dehydrogenase
MAYKAKIFGAGSIGNHLAQACRRAGWDVVVVDRDPKALKRMKEEIYPTRYGAWDDAITLFESGKEPKGGFDVIFIGTPPHVRMPIAMEALAEKPKVLQLEKPLGMPSLEGVAQFVAKVKKGKTAVIVGYDHSVSDAAEFIVSLLTSNTIGSIETLDVEFREHWGGIFKAHPWLSGPADTYLGFTEKGGGASGEHSHALHLWIYLAQVAGLGLPKEVSALYEWRKEGKAVYDAIATFSMLTNKKKIGRVVQDVVTSPTRKWIRVQGKNGFIEWYCNGKPEGDHVVWKVGDQPMAEKVFPKKRPDDFFKEVQHIEALLSGKVNAKDSPMSLQNALHVMSVLSATRKKKGVVSTPIKTIKV